MFHHLHSVGPKQLCALAHLGCIREAGTSQFRIKWNKKWPPIVTGLEPAIPRSEVWCLIH